VQGYRDLKVWQKAMELAELAYRLARLMPKEEQYRITAQMLRSAASVPANIAEGYQRATRRDYAHFISIAQGSLAETQTFLVLATRVGLLSESSSGPALLLADELSRMLYSLRKKLASPKPSPLSPNPRHQAFEAGS
jgi:four helix bundle protein